MSLILIRIKLNLQLPRADTVSMLTYCDMKQAAALMGETEAKFDYVEHVLIGLKSVAYYGQDESH